MSSATNATRCGHVDGSSPASGTLRERPAFRAMATLIRELGGTTCHGALADPDLPGGARALRFTREGREIVVAWSTAGAVDWVPPSAPGRVVGRDGGEEPLASAAYRLLASPRYFIRVLR